MAMRSKGSSFESVALMEQFFNDVIGAPKDGGPFWFYGGGYAYYRWCQYYGLPEVETKDYDVYLDPAFVEKVRERIQPGEEVEGKTITLHSTGIGPGYVDIGGSHLQSPEVLARAYGTKKDQGLLRSIKKPSADEEIDQEKADRRRRRQDGMDALLAKFFADVKGQKLKVYQ